MTAARSSIIAQQMCPPGLAFQFVESDADAELLFNIPFTGNVKLKGIIVLGGEHETHPKKMRL